MWFRYSGYWHLAYRGHDKMATTLVMTFSNAFSWVKICSFWFKFHWNVFIGFHLNLYTSTGADNGLAPNSRQTIIWNNDGQQWCIYVSFSLNELMNRYWYLICLLKCHQSEMQIEILLYMNISIHLYFCALHHNISNNSIHLFGVKLATRVTYIIFYTVNFQAGSLSLDCKIDTKWYCIMNWHCYKRMLATDNIQGLGSK